MTAQRYLAIFSATLTGLMLLAFLSALVQAGAPTRNGYYTCKYLAGKIARGRMMASPKLVIIAGSNAIHGIDAGRLGGALGIRAFNFGLSASFGPGFQTFEGAKALKPGDAALLPLEYLAYDYTTPSDSLVDAVYSCGGDYWASLPWRERLFFVLAVKPWRSIDALVFQHNKKAMARASAQASADVGLYGQGDLAAMEARMPHADMRGLPPLAIHLDETAPGPRAIARFAAWARENNVTVFATWPNTLAFAAYAREPGFARIADFYRRLGVPVLGQPEDALFPPSSMGDTIYHLNAKGMDERTQRLIVLLKSDPAFRAWRDAGAK